MKNIDYDLDSLIKEQEEREMRDSEVDAGTSGETGKVLIGTVEKYFHKLGVAAVQLKSEVAVGDIIEIGTKESAIRQKVESMQIDRESVNSARAGDSVGILVRCPVKEKDPVYKIL